MFIMVVFSDYISSSLISLSLSWLCFIALAIGFINYTKIYRLKKVMDDLRFKSQLFQPFNTRNIESPKFKIYEIATVRGKIYHFI